MSVHRVGESSMWRQTGAGHPKQPMLPLCETLIFWSNNGAKTLLGGDCTMSNASSDAPRSFRR
jgi:hypothetical protein